VLPILFADTFLLLLLLDDALLAALLADYAVPANPPYVVPL
jgi:hypothetical protein